VGKNELIEGLREALAHLGRDGASGPLVTNMMAKCRKLLEGTATKSAYPIAKLFGNWALHAELTSDKAAIEILEDVNQFVVGLMQGAGGGPFGPEITRRIKLADLRLELLAICKAFHIAEQPIADKGSWAAIQKNLLGELCGQPHQSDRKEASCAAQKVPRRALVGDRL